MTAAAGQLEPTDAELVARILAADRDAFATVYDRYGSRLYDFAYSMLRHPEDAADSVADSFVTVAERLGQLRDPHRLRPWLYAVVRSECLRRLRARKRTAYADDEQLAAMADDAATPEQAAERAALQQLVWEAAAGLADRDRALLDLHLRQGLEGAELGEAMGVSAANAYVMLNRLKAQVDRSLGAFLIARRGRDDCDELDALLADWDGTFSPLVRKRVARHIERCDLCGERRKRLVSPLALLAGIPLLAAPATLRDRVLEDSRLVGFFTGAPFGTPTGRHRGLFRDVRFLVLGLLLLAGLGFGSVQLWPSGDHDVSLPATTSTPTAPPPGAGPPSAGLPTTDPGPTHPTSPPSTASPTSASPTDSTAPLPGSLTLSRTSIDLGAAGARGSVDLVHAGDLPVDWAATTSTGWVQLSQASGRLSRGRSRLVVSVDRASVPEGAVTADVRVTWSGGSAVLSVRLTTDRDPVVGAPRSPETFNCSEPATVRVTVSDESRLTSVVLRWSGQASGAVEMKRVDGTWQASIGPLPAGIYELRAAATDARGNAASGGSSSVVWFPCPG